VEESVGPLNAPPSNPSPGGGGHSSVPSGHRKIGMHAGRYSLHQKLKEEKDYLNSGMEALERPRKKSSENIQVADIGEKSPPRSRTPSPPKKPTPEATRTKTKTKTSPSAENNNAPHDGVAENGTDDSTAPVVPAIKSPVVDRRKSQAEQHWGKIRLATKMATAFKEVNEDLKKYGATADDDHIDWNKVHDGDNLNGLYSGKEKAWYIIHPSAQGKTSWDIFMSLVLAYVAFYVPYRVCLYWDDDELTGILLAIECVGLMAARSEVMSGCVGEVVACLCTPFYPGNK